MTHHDPASDDTPGLRGLRDRQALRDLLDGYFIAIDRRRFDDAWAESVFTPDVELVFPVASHTGLGGIVAVHERLVGRFERTQHIPSSHVIDLGPTHAVVGANVLMIHVHPSAVRAERQDDSPFVVGGYFEARTMRTRRGWRVRGMQCDVVWTSGQPPAGVSE
jgi:hypothetical protein